MSALETLPPDQRAVLQLILKQGRGYADLSGLLRIDEAAVRARALAGLEALGDGSGQALSPERRAQVADYLLGQQDDAERDATRRYLDDSAAARRWAGTLHAALTPVARDPLPELPAARTNGHALVAEAPAQPAAAQPAAAPHDDAAAAVPPADDAAPRTADAAPPRDRPAPAFRPRPEPTPDRGGRDGAPRRSSRVGGLLLLAGVLILLVVLAFVIFGGGDDDDPSSGSTPPPQTQGQDPAADPSASAAADDILAQVNLAPTGAGGAAIGVGFVQTIDGRPLIGVQVNRIAANGEQDIYAVWLRSRAGRPTFLGFVPRQVGRDGTFTVSAEMPGRLAGDEVLVTREPITTTGSPTRPSDVLLTGTLRLRG